MRNNTQARYGIFYRSNGRWTTSPYMGVTFTQHTINRRPVTEDIKLLQNRILKSRIKILPVVA